MSKKRAAPNRTRTDLRISMLAPVRNSTRAAVESAGYHPRIVVKFRDAVSLPYVDDVARHIDQKGIGPWRSLAAKFPGIEIRRLFNSVTPVEISRLVAEAQHRSAWYRPPNLLTYFVVDLPPQVADEDEGRKYAESLVNDLRAWGSVEHAYFDPMAAEPERNTNGPQGIQDPDMPLQEYLFVANGGIGADVAWAVPGGTGVGVQFIDVERCWTRDHADLDGRNIQLLCGDENEKSRAHGTAVLGIVCAVQNNFGCRGIAPGVDRVTVASWWGAGNSIANTVKKANAALNPGDVLLLEIQQKDSKGAWVPAEVNWAEFDAIKAAVARGIVVIAAAGNTGVDLDSVLDAKGDAVFAPAAERSGAIIVGCSTSTPPFARLASNYGTRVDCFAWGEKVFAPSSTGPADLTGNVPNFDGTSSASAIIAGAAIVAQGMAIAQFGTRLTCPQMREVLVHASAAVTSQNGTADRIGVMPNLEEVINNGVIGQVLAQNPLP